MSDAVIIALGVAVVAALVVLILQLRRKPQPAAGIDQAELGRLVSATVTESLSAQTRSAEHPPSPDRSTGRDLEALRAAAAAEAAETRKAATAAAEDLRARSRAEADQARADARAAADRTLSAARAEAAEHRDNLAAERRRLLTEAAESVAAERTELQAAQLRLAGFQESYAADRRTLASELERLRSEQSELSRARAGMESREETLRAERERQQARDAELATRSAELDAAQLGHDTELVRISGLTQEAARAELLARQEEGVRRDAAYMIRRVVTEAEATAKEKARAIVAEAIQRVASDQTAQTVVSVVHLPAEEIKGRIIGREGRNIRAFETVTGVNVIIDDTPEAVLLSCFDPVRREIGRVTLQMLIEDGRIHPHRIEEAYERATDEVDALCRRAAEDALLEVGISDLHPELVRLVGRLKYRTSYGQNVLGHLVETAHIAKVMAAELGVDPVAVVRGAFLHDIGKALTHEVSGSHALIGAELARKYGESETVVHCIEAHHDEVPPTTVEAVLTQAADACSGGRPGARRESLESYVQRLERIEAIASAKKGVEKVFAMQAGRELRVMVKPDIVDDLEAHVLAREVAKQIEEELTYPGQVRVTVIRESRATEVAR